MKLIDTAGTLAAQDTGGRRCTTVPRGRRDLTCPLHPVRRNAGPRQEPRGFLLGHKEGRRQETHLGCADAETRTRLEASPPPPPFDPRDFGMIAGAPPVDLDDIGRDAAWRMSSLRSY